MENQEETLYTQDEKKLLKLMLEQPTKLSRMYKFLEDQEILSMIKRKIIVDGKKPSQIAEILNKMGKDLGQEEKFKCSAQTLARQLTQLRIVKEPIKNKEEYMLKLDKEIEDKLLTVKFLNKKISELEKTIKSYEESEDK